MRVLDGNGCLANRIQCDPRWTASQRNAALHAAEVDPDAEIEGLDQKLRPVIRARLDRETANAPRSVYALLRNGAPAKPVMPYVERWRKTAGRRTGAN